MSDYTKFSDDASTKPGEADLSNSEECGSSRFPKRARISVEKFQPVVLMNFQKTEKSRSKKNDRERKQASRKDKKMDDSSHSDENNPEDTKN